VSPKPSTRAKLSTLPPSRPSAGSTPTPAYGGLVLDAEARARRHVDALAGDLDLESAPALEGIREAAQLRDEFRRGIDLPDIAIHRGVSLVLQTRLTEPS
jgi:hypothetical protein